MSRFWAALLSEPLHVFTVAVLQPKEGEDLRGIFSTVDKAIEFIEEMDEDEQNNAIIWEWEVDSDHDFLSGFVATIPHQYEGGE